MKKIFYTVLLSLVLLPLSAYAGTGGSISATDVEQEVIVYGNHLLLVNDGANEVFFEVTQTGEPDRVATTSSFKLNSGESIVLDTTRDLTEVSLICSAAETATVRYKTWL